MPSAILGAVCGRVRDTMRPWHALGVPSRLVAVVYFGLQFGLRSKLAGEGLCMLIRDALRKWSSGGGALAEDQCATRRRD